MECLNPPVLLCSGLDFDGLYRVSGNMAEIQKLRIQVDSGKTPFYSVLEAFFDVTSLPRLAGAPYDLSSAQWEVHVLTGALKLFFRELREPLIPYVFYNKFLAVLSE